LIRLRPARDKDFSCSYTKGTQWKICNSQKRTRLFYFIE